MRPSLPLVLALLASSSPTQGPFRELDFEEALALAAREEKVVFVDFFTTWCEPCKKLDRITWKDPSVMSWLEASTIPLKVDAEKNRELASRYGIRSYPTLLFVAADGKPKGGLVGYRSPKDFIAEGGDIVAGVQLSRRLREKWLKDSGNPDLRHELGRQLERELAYEEAAEHYLWCWDHGGDDASRGFSRVRHSKLLTDMGRLMRMHSPLKVVMIERRDRAREVAMGEQPTAGACLDFVRLSETLGDRKSNLAAYDELGARQAQGEAEAPGFDPRGALFVHVVDLLLDAQRYSDAVAGYGDPERWLEGRLAQYEVLTASPHDEQALKALLKQVLVDGTQLYEALSGTREHDDVGRKVAVRLVAVEEGPKPWIELMYAARRADRRDVQEELRAQALAVLPLIEHKRIPKVRERKRKR
jgi:thiol-disulfide isomerase/thioredoxin